MPVGVGGGGGGGGGGCRAGRAGERGVASGAAWKQGLDPQQSSLLQRKAGSMRQCSTWHSTAAQHGTARHGTAQRSAAHLGLGRQVVLAGLLSGGSGLGCRLRLLWRALLASWSRSRRGGSRCRSGRRCRSGFRSSRRSGRCGSLLLLHQRGVQAVHQPQLASLRAESTLRQGSLQLGLHSKGTTAPAQRLSNTRGLVYGRQFITLRQGSLNRGMVSRSDCRPGRALAGAEV